MSIRNILQVPETYRAMPEKKKRVRKPKPMPEPSLVERLEQYQNKGIPAKIEYCKTTKSYYIVANTTTPPSWEESTSASEQWKAVALC